MNAQYFINKFEAIPEDQWCVDEYENQDGCKCAYGHCGVNIGNTTDEGFALHEIIHSGLRVFVDMVNDGSAIGYNQATPKQRILAALRDAKSKGR